MSLTMPICDEEADNDHLCFPQKRLGSFWYGIGIDNEYGADTEIQEDDKYVDHLSQRGSTINKVEL